MITCAGCAIILILWRTKKQRFSVPNQLLSNDGMWKQSIILSRTLNCYVFAIMLLMVAFFMHLSASFPQVVFVRHVCNERCPFLQFIHENSFHWSRCCKQRKTLHRNWWARARSLVFTISTSELGNRTTWMLCLQQTLTGHYYCSYLFQLSHYTFYAFFSFGFSFKWFFFSSYSRLLSHFHLVFSRFYFPSRIFFLFFFPSSQHQ